MGGTKKRQAFFFFFREDPVSRHPSYPALPLARTFFDKTASATKTNLRKANVCRYGSVRHGKPAPPRQSLQGICGIFCKPMRLETNAPTVNVRISYRSLVTNIVIPTVRILSNFASFFATHRSTSSRVRFFARICPVFLHTTEYIAQSFLRGAQPASLFDKNTHEASRLSVAQFD